MSRFKSLNLSQHLWPTHGPVASFDHLEAVNCCGPCSIDLSNFTATVLQSFFGLLFSMHFAFLTLWFQHTLQVMTFLRGFSTVASTIDSQLFGHLERVLCRVLRVFVGACWIATGSKSSRCISSVVGHGQWKNCMHRWHSWALERLGKKGWASNSATELECALNVPWLCKKARRLRRL